MKAHCTFNQKKALVGAFGHSLFKLRDCSFAALLGRCKSVLGRVCVNTRSAERLSSWRWVRRWRGWARITSNLSAWNKFQVKTQSQPQSGTAATPAFLVVALLLNVSVGIFSIFCILPIYRNQYAVHTLYAACFTGQSGAS